MSYCELTCSHVVSRRSVKSDNTVLCTSGNINVIDTCTCTAYSLKTVSVSEKFRSDLGSRSYDKSVEALDVLIDFFLGMTEILLNLVTLIS